MRRQSEKEARLATNTVAVSHRAIEEGQGGGRGEAMVDTLELKYIQLNFHRLVAVMATYVIHVDHLTPVAVRIRLPQHYADGFKPQYAWNVTL